MKDGETYVLKGMAFMWVFHLFRQFWKNIGKKTEIKNPVGDDPLYKPGLDYTIFFGEIGIFGDMTTKTHFSANQGQDINKSVVKGNYDIYEKRDKITI